MPDINRGALLVSILGSERIRTRHVDRTWQAAPALARIGGGRMLLSFERPATRRPFRSTELGRASSEDPRAPATGGTARLFADLENCTVAKNIGYHPGEGCNSFSRDHRQDSKGTWWMPWHQESMKDVNGCDKPR